MVVALVEHGSITGAAKRLNQPKSTVSRRLAELETQLQLTLFQRTTRAMSLTDAGRRIYELAKPAIDAANEVAEAIAEGEKTISGKVTITATAALGQYLIVPRLPDLIKRHPGLQIALQLTERRINIVSEGVDLAVRMGSLDNSDLIARRLTKVRRQLVASPAYLEVHGTPNTPSDLARHRAVLTTGTLDRWRFSNGHEAQMQWNIAAGNMLAAHQLVRNGVGIGLLPDFLIADDLASGALVKQLAKDFHDEADLWLVSSRQRYRSAAVRAVHDLLSSAGEVAGSKVPAAFGI